MLILTTPKKRKPADGVQARAGSDTTFNTQSLAELAASVKAIVLAGRDEGANHGV